MNTEGLTKSFITFVLMKRNDLYAIIHTLLLLAVCVVTFFLNYRTLYVKDVSYNLVMTHRLISAIAGTMLTFFIYLLGKEISQREDFAWIASLLFCGSYAVISFGRTPSAGICSYAVMMGAGFFIYCTFKERQGTWLSAIIAGVCLGVSYMCSQWQTYIVVLLPFLVAFISFCRPIEWKRWRQLLVILILGVLVASLSLFDLDFFHSPVGQYIIVKDSMIWNIKDIHLNYYYFFHLFWNTGVWSLLFCTTLLYSIWMEELKKQQVYLLSLLWLLLQLVIVSFSRERNVVLLIPIAVSQSLLMSAVLIVWHDKLKKRSARKEDQLFVYNGYLLSAICMLVPIVGYWMIYKSGYMIFDRYLLFAIYALIISSGLFIATWKRIPYFVVYGVTLLILIGEVMM